MCAYRQPYRGNPELKQYRLINDFSGGLDTVSLDEKMRDNEFREMKNIELSLQGSISNRKGFGELEHLNQWLENNNIILPTGRTNLLKIIKDDGNVLLAANDFVEYSSFETFMNNSTYELKILLNFQVDDKVEFKLLTIKNSTGEAEVTLKDLASFDGILRDVLNVHTINYVQKIYFISYDCYITSDDDYKGLVYYDDDEETINFLTPTNTYKPTPYEVESFGFNVLREKPLLDVDSQGFGDYSILGTYLTDTEGNFIEKIPTSGNFNLIAFQIGELMHPTHVTLSIKDQNDKNLDYTLLNSYDGGGYFVYEIRNMALPSVTSITFSFTKNEQQIYDVSQVPPITATAAVSSTKYIFVENNRDRYFMKKDGVTTTYSKSDFNVGVVVTSYHKEADLSPNGIPGMLFYTSNEDKYWKYVSYGEYDELIEGEDYVLISDEEVLNVDFNKIFRVLDSSIYSYYVYNGETDFESTDFDTTSVPQEILPFTVSYFVGNNDTTENTKPLDLNGAHIEQIQDRLVIFKGNTVYFSEQFQYDYIPNTNYFMLPLRSTDEITRIYYFRGVHIIFTKESIWRMSGTIFGEDWLITKVNDFIGCIAPNSVRGLNNNLIFLSNQGLYLLTQSYYQEGLENVKKVDEKIGDLVRLDTNAYSVMYKDQYWLISENDDYSSIKYYFNIEKVGGGHPFVTDKYRVVPKNLENLNNVLYTVQDGVFYRYDKGYTDFLPRGSLSTEIPNYMYNYRFVTKNDDFGYPTHDKKIKAVYFKIRNSVLSQLHVTIFVNERAVIDPYSYETTINEYGEVVYERKVAPNLEIDPEAELGEFILGKDRFGSEKVQVHKFVIGEKAKNISIAIEQSTNGYFNIEDIGYVYKLGKVKETR
jgi:hypothetical protein